MLEIQVGGLELFGAPLPSAQGEAILVKPDGLQGWRGLPAGRREALARAVEHGEHDVPVYLPSRVVTIDGWVLAESEDRLEHLSDALAGLGATGDRMRFQVTSRGETRWADGRRVSGEVQDSPGGFLEAEYQLQFVFADPRKYGGENVYPKTGTAVSISAAHYGNFPAFPVVEIPSAPAGYTVTSSGQTFVVAGATAGGTHTVDMRRGRVYRNGVEMPGVGRGDLWTVPPGRGVLFTLSVPGRVKALDTFI
ncbi:MULTISPECIES: hypothetical protein [unclassified Microbacterium]|uniref:hypothetical protein n=1 Tax=unclassified Microbacterium TaxID=2609290 RepID=UPI0010F4B91A|nr:MULTISPECIES: hypothetical protein [unclassified Microbacterium]